MANDQQLVQYTRGQFNLAPGGRMRQVTNVSASINVNPRLKHTLAQSPSGYVLGNVDCSGSFNIEVPKTGLERDIFGTLRKGQPVEAQIEIPLARASFAIVLGQVQLEVPLDDAVRLTVSFIGKFTGEIPASS